MNSILTSTIADGSNQPVNQPQSWTPWAIGLGIGITVFLICRGLIRLHWKRVGKDPAPGEFASVWTDVILRVVSYVGVLVALLGILGLAASLLSANQAG